MIGTFAAVNLKVSFRLKSIIMVIKPIKKTCLAGWRVTVQTICRNFLSGYGAGLWGSLQGLPLPRQKKLIHLAFPSPKLRRSGHFNPYQNLAYSTNNQQDTSNTLGAKSQFLGIKTTRTDFEFNKPILKKEAPILKDFEKNGADFERFRTDFEQISKPGMAAHGKQTVKIEIFSSSRQKFQPPTAKRSLIVPWHELGYIRRA
jgi:hypothetical protein